MGQKGSSRILDYPEATGRLGQTDAVYYEQVFRRLTTGSNSSVLSVTAFLNYALVSLPNMPKELSSRLSLIFLSTDAPDFLSYKRGMFTLEDFISGVGLLLHGTSKEKAQFLFRLYDLSGEGKLYFMDLLKMLIIIMNRPPASTATASAHLLHAQRKIIGRVFHDAWTRALTLTKRGDSATKLLRLSVEGSSSEEALSQLFLTLQEWTAWVDMLYTSDTRTDPFRSPDHPLLCWLETFTHVLRPNAYLDGILSRWMRESGTTGAVEFDVAAGPLKVPAAPTQSHLSATDTAILQKLYSQLKTQSPSGLFNGASLRQLFSPSVPHILSDVLFHATVNKGEVSLSFAQLCQLCNRMLSTNLTDKARLLVYGCDTGKRGHLGKQEFANLLLVSALSGKLAQFSKPQPTNSSLDPKDRCIFDTSFGVMDKRGLLQLMEQVQTEISSLKGTIWSSVCPDPSRMYISNEAIINWIADRHPEALDGFSLVAKALYLDVGITPPFALQAELLAYCWRGYIRSKARVGNVWYVAPSQWWRSLVEATELDIELQSRRLEKEHAQTPGANGTRAAAIGFLDHFPHPHAYAPESVIRRPSDVFQSSLNSSLSLSRTNSFTHPSRRSSKRSSSHNAVRNSGTERRSFLEIQTSLPATPSAPPHTHTLTSPTPPGEGLAKEGKGTDGALDRTNAAASAQSSEVHSAGTTTPFGTTPPLLSPLAISRSTTPPSSSTPGIGSASASQPVLDSAPGTNANTPTAPLSPTQEDGAAAFASNPEDIHKRPSIRHARSFTEGRMDISAFPPLFPAEDTGSPRYRKPRFRSSTVNERMYAIGPIPTRKLLMDLYALFPNFEPVTMPSLQTVDAADSEKSKSSRSSDLGKDKSSSGSKTSSRLNGSLSATSTAGISSSNTTLSATSQPPKPKALFYPPILRTDITRGYHEDFVLLPSRIWNALAHWYNFDGPAIPRRVLHSAKTNQPEIELDPMTVKLTRLVPTFPKHTNTNAPTASIASTVSAQDPRSLAPATSKSQRIEASTSSSTSSSTDSASLPLSPKGSTRGTGDMSSAWRTLQIWSNRLPNPVFLDLPAYYSCNEVSIGSFSSSTGARLQSSWTVGQTPRGSAAADWFTSPLLQISRSTTLQEVHAMAAQALSYSKEKVRIWVKGRTVATEKRMACLESDPILKSALDRWSYSPLVGHVPEEDFSLPPPKQLRKRRLRNTYTRRKALKNLYTSSSTNFPSDMQDSNLFSPDAPLNRLLDPWSGFYVDLPVISVVGDVPNLVLLVDILRLGPNGDEYIWEAAFPIVYDAPESEVKGTKAANAASLTLFGKKEAELSSPPVPSPKARALSLTRSNGPLPASPSSVASSMLTKERPARTEAKTTGGSFATPASSSATALAAANSTTASIGGEEDLPLDEESRFEGSWEDYYNLLSDVSAVNMSNVPCQARVPIELLRGDEVAVMEKRRSTMLLSTSIPLLPNSMVGFENLGNSCYLNSILECLIALPFFAQYFLRDSWQLDLNPNSKFGSGGRFAVAFALSLREIWSERPKGHSKSSVYTPKLLKNELAKVANRFEGRDQHDAVDALGVILSTLGEDLNRVSSAEKPYNEVEDSGGRDDVEVAEEWWIQQVLARERSWVTNTFVGQFKSTLRCANCNHTSVRFEPFSTLPLPLPAPSWSYVSTLVIQPPGLAMGHISGSFVETSQRSMPDYRGSFSSLSGFNPMMSNLDSSFDEKELSFALGGHRSIFLLSFIRPLAVTVRVPPQGMTVSEFRKAVALQIRIRQGHSESDEEMKKCAINRLYKFEANNCDFQAPLTEQTAYYLASLPCTEDQLLVLRSSHGSLVELEANSIPFLKDSDKIESFHSSIAPFAYIVYRLPPLVAYWIKYSQTLRTRRSAMHLENYALVPGTPVWYRESASGRAFPATIASSEYAAEFSGSGGIGDVGDGSSKVVDKGSLNESFTSDTGESPMGSLDTDRGKVTILQQLQAHSSTPRLALSAFTTTPSDTPDTSPVAVKIPTATTLSNTEESAASASKADDATICCRREQDKLATDSESSSSLAYEAHPVTGNAHGALQGAGAMGTPHVPSLSVAAANTAHTNGAIPSGTVTSGSNSSATGSRNRRIGSLDATATGMGKTPVGSPVTDALSGNAGATTGGATTNDATTSGAGAVVGVAAGGTSARVSNSNAIAIADGKTTARRHSRFSANVAVSNIAIDTTARPPMPPKDVVSSAANTANNSDSIALGMRPPTPLPNFIAPGKTPTISPRNVDCQDTTRSSVTDYTYKDDSAAAFPPLLPTSLSLSLSNGQNVTLSSVSDIAPRVPYPHHFVVSHCTFALVGSGNTPVGPLQAYSANYANGYAGGKQTAGQALHTRQTQSGAGLYSDTVRGLCGIGAREIHTFMNKMTIPPSISANAYYLSPLTRIRFGFPFLFRVVPEYTSLSRLYVLIWETCRRYIRRLPPYLPAAQSSSSNSSVNLSAAGAYAGPSGRSFDTYAPNSHAASPFFTPHPSPRLPTTPSAAGTAGPKGASNVNSIVHALPESLARPGEWSALEVVDAWGMVVRRAVSTTDLNFVCPTCPWDRGCIGCVVPPDPTRTLASYMASPATHPSPHAIPWGNFPSASSKSAVPSGVPANSGNTAARATRVGGSATTPPPDQSPSAQGYSPEAYTYFVVEWEPSILESGYDRMEAAQFDKDQSCSDALLEYEKPVTLSSCLELFSKEEELDDEVYCANCSKEEVEVRLEVSNTKGARSGKVVDASSKKEDLTLSSATNLLQETGMAEKTEVIGPTETIASSTSKPEDMTKSAISSPESFSSTTSPFASERTDTLPLDNAATSDVQTNASDPAEIAPILDSASNDSNSLSVGTATPTAADPIPAADSILTAEKKDRQSSITERPKLPLLRVSTKNSTGPTRQNARHLRSSTSEPRSEGDDSDIDTPCFRPAMTPAGGNAESSAALDSLDSIKNKDKNGMSPLATPTAHGEDDDASAVRMRTPLYKTVKESVITLRKHNKRLELYRLPPFMVIQLKRFEHTQYVHRKLNTKVIFPASDPLNVQPFLSANPQSFFPSSIQPIQPASARTRSDTLHAGAEEKKLPFGVPVLLSRSQTEFHLYGIVNHEGVLGGGHYTSYFRSLKNGDWWFGNDKIVEPIVKPSESSASGQSDSTEQGHSTQVRNSLFSTTTEILSLPLSRHGSFTRLAGNGGVTSPRAESISGCKSPKSPKPNQPDLFISVKPIESTPNFSTAAKDDALPSPIGLSDSMPASPSFVDGYFKATGTTHGTYAVGSLDSRAGVGFAVNDRVTDRAELRLQDGPKTNAVGAAGLLVPEGNLSPNSAFPMSPVSQSKCPTVESFPTGSRGSFLAVDTSIGPGNRYHSFASDSHLHEKQAATGRSPTSSLCTADGPSYGQAPLSLDDILVTSGAYLLFYVRKDIVDGWETTVRKEKRAEKAATAAKARANAEKKGGKAGLAASIVSNLHGPAMHVLQTLNSSITSHTAATLKSIRGSHLAFPTSVSTPVATPAATPMATSNAEQTSLATPDASPNQEDTTPPQELSKDQGSKLDANKLAPALADNAVDVPLSLSDLEIADATVGEVVVAWVSETPVLETNADNVEAQTGSASASQSAPLSPSSIYLRSGEISATVSDDENDQNSDADSDDEYNSDIESAIWPQTVEQIWPPIDGKVPCKEIEHIIASVVGDASFVKSTGNVIMSSLTSFLPGLQPASTGTNVAPKTAVPAKAKENATKPASTTATTQPTPATHSKTSGNCELM